MPALTRAAVASALVLAVGPAPAARRLAPGPTFRSGMNVVLVDATSATTPAGS